MACLPTWCADKATHIYRYITTISGPVFRSAPRSVRGCWPVREKREFSWQQRWLKIREGMRTFAFRRFYDFVVIVVILVVSQVMSFFFFFPRCFTDAYHYVATKAPREFKQNWRGESSTHYHCAIVMSDFKVSQFKKLNTNPTICNAKRKISSVISPS